MKRAFFVVSRAVAFVALGGLAAIVGVKFLPSQPAQPVLSVLPVAFSFSDASSASASSALAAPGPKGASPLTPTGSGFTYQGRLTNGGNPASGSFDFVFTLFDAASAGNQISGPITLTNQTVTGGLFTVSLDFGPSAFDGNARYLELAVRASGGGSYTTLSPRQPITPAPYALFALKTTPYKNVVVVAQSGGQYTSISAALNSITDASSTNHYLVYVAPGVYTETVIMKQYVDIEGAGEQSTKITFTGTGVGLTPGTVIGASNAELRFLTVENTGGNTYAWAVNTSGASPSLLHVTAHASGGSFSSIGVYNSASSPTMTNVTASASSSSAGAASVGVYNDTNSSPTMTNVTASGAGVYLNIGVENEYSSPSMTNITASASGPAGSSNEGVYNYTSPSTMTNITASASGPAGSSNYGVYNTSNGPATVTISNSKITGSTNTIYNDFGSTTVIGASQLAGGPVFNRGGSTLTCSASFDGNNKRLGADCTRNTKVAIVGLTDGDYTSITAALSDLATWCGTPSSTNRCLVRVGPGTYTEQVTMRQYVDIEGAGEQSTKITYTGSASPNTGTVIGAAASAELRFLTVQNTGGNSYAIAIYDSVANPSLLHVTANASGGSVGNYGVFNTTSSSPPMTNVTANAAGPSSSANYGVYNISSSFPSMNNVTAFAYGSGSTNNIGVFNSTNSSPTMNNVTASASGDTNSSCIGVENLSSASPSMTNVTASASCDLNNYGVFNTNSSPTMTNVTASGSGGSGNYGVYDQSGGTVTINNSKITGSTNTIINFQSTTRVGASQLAGGNVSNAGTLTCSASYDENYVSPGLNVCP